MFTSIAVFGLSAVDYINRGIILYIEKRLTIIFEQVYRKWKLQEIIIIH